MPFIKGFTHTKVARKIMSEASKAYWDDPENRKYQSEKRKAFWQEHPERRVAMSQRLLGNTHTKGMKHKPETLLKISIANRGNKHLLGHIHSEQARAKMSLARRGKPKSLIHAQNLRKHLASIQSPTSIEIILLSRLKQEFPRRKIIPEYFIGPFRFDFGIPSLKLLFEADGEYWHSSNWAKNRDRLKDNLAKKQGWIVTRHSGSEIRSWK